MLGGKFRPLLIPVRQTGVLTPGVVPLPPLLKLSPSGLTSFSDSRLPDLPGPGAPVHKRRNRLSRRVAEILPLCQ